MQGAQYPPSQSDRKRLKVWPQQLEQAWQNTEVDALYKLAAIDVRVPKSYGCFDGVVIMELITDDEGQVAPRLNDVSMSAKQALEDHAIMIRYISVCCLPAWCMETYQNSMYWLMTMVR